MEQSSKTARQLFEDVKKNPTRKRFGFGARPAIVNVDLAKAAEWSDTPRSFDQKYGAMASIVAKLGEEFASKVEMAPAL